MSSDPYAHLPNLTGAAGELEGTRGEDPSRFFPSVRGGQADAVTGRILDVPRVRVVSTAAQSIPNAGATAIVFDSAPTYDTDGLFNPRVDATKIFAKVAGVYLCSGWLAFTGSGAGNVREGWIGSSTAQLFKYGVEYKGITGTPIQSTCQSSALIVMSAGDWVSLGCFQDSGGALALTTVTSGTPAISASLTVVLVSTIGSDNQ